MRRHRRHHQVVERLCCAGALRLHHCGFGSRCQLCSHIGCISVFLTLFTNTKLLRRFRRCPGRLLCGERVAPPPGRHCPGRGLLHRAVGQCRYVSIIAGPNVTRKLARHMTFASIPSLIYDRYLRSCAGCCAGVLRRRAAAACWRSAWGAPFCHEGRYFSPLHEGLALCFVRHVSAHHSLLPLVYRLTGNSTLGGSMFIVAACSMCFPKVFF